MPRPLPREEQYLEPPSETTEELKESGESKEESSSEDDLLPDIPEQSQSQGQEPLEKELLKDSEHNLEIEEFHVRSESGSEDEQEPSTAQYLDNEGQHIPNTELCEELVPEPNPEPREQNKARDVRQMNTSCQKQKQV
jgi:hypothetical protein